MELSKEERKKAFLAQMQKKREAAGGGGSGQVKIFSRVKAQMPKELVDGVGEQFGGINDFVEMLPHNYTFEVKKSVWRCLESKATVVALQMPEGLLMYACLIADILERYAKVQTIIMGDVTYGACCVDDYTAKALGADLLIHYGHSCLVSVAESSIAVQYVFVDIRFDVSHLVETVKFNFKRDQRLVIVGTIQFASSFHEAKQMLEKDFDHLCIPQEHPLSGGELLGCTSPKLPSDIDAIIYVADGRFHLESIMIANPGVPAYKYDPHSKKFTEEKYDNKTMMALRKAEVDKAKNAKLVGIIVGTLGRQGNLSIFARLQRAIEGAGKEVVVVLLSEIFQSKLELMSNVDAWVQIACPRLSIDWGHAFKKPLLNPYEAFACFGNVGWKDVYPQDYYSKKGDIWSNYFKE